MKRLQVSEGILPLGEFKRTASSVLRRMREDGRPFVITQHGRPAAVLLLPEEYDRLSEREWFVVSVEAGLADDRAGRTISDEELTQDLEGPGGSSID